MIEIFAVIFTLISVYLTTKNKISNWPIGIIGLIFYVLVFSQVHLYAQVILQIVFLLQSIYGWYNWAKLKNKPPAPITILTTNEKFGWFCSIFVFTGVLLQILLYTSGTLPMLDSFTASISLVANWLLAKRKLENWYLWIFVDIIYICIFTYMSLYLSAVLYLVFFFMSIYGLYNWKIEYYNSDKRISQN